ncbi:MAG: phenylalanine--tRNA ligase subunit beta [Phylliscum demangeonii]|nr:MAG: phenylalanine--tRNA ligase subunit beta [Phylliscum demangeonii]
MGVGKCERSGSIDRSSLVAAQSRHALCETLRYYRAFQSAAYLHEGLCFGMLFERQGSDRDVITDDVLVTRCGGGTSKVDGEMAQTADQSSDHAVVQAKGCSQPDRTPARDAGQSPKTAEYSLSHLLSCIERCKERLLAVGRGEGGLNSLGNAHALAEAQTVAMNLLRGNASDPEALVLRGRALYGQGEHDKAISHPPLISSSTPLSLSFITDAAAAVRYPGLLKTIAKTSTAALPIKVFEVPDALFEDRALERKSRNERHFATVWCGKTSDFEVLRRQNFASPFVLRMQHEGAHGARMTDAVRRRRRQQQEAAAAGEQRPATVAAKPEKAEARHQKLAASSLPRFSTRSFRRRSKACIESAAGSAEEAVVGHVDCMLMLKTAFLTHEEGLEGTSVDGSRRAAAASLHPHLHATLACRVPRFHCVDYESRLALAADPFRMAQHQARRREIDHMKTPGAPRKTPCFSRWPRKCRPRRRQRKRKLPVFNFFGFRDRSVSAIESAKAFWEEAERQAAVKAARRRLVHRAPAAAVEVAQIILLSSRPEVPKTIGKRETDGTPREHIVEIREASTKFDFPQNTTYPEDNKNLRQAREQWRRTAKAPEDLQEDASPTVPSKISSSPEDEALATKIFGRDRRASASGINKPGRQGMGASTPSRKGMGPSTPSLASRVGDTKGPGATGPSRSSRVPNVPKMPGFRPLSGLRGSGRKEFDVAYRAVPSPVSERELRKRWRCVWTPGSSRPAAGGHADKRTQEIKFGDSDTLSAITAAMVQAD